MISLAQKSNAKSFPKKFKRLLPFLLIVFILGSLNFYSNKKSPTQKIKIDKQLSALNLNVDLLSIFDLGQRRLLSSVYWISTLIESDLEHYKKRDLNSWLYLRFNAIATLDPFFLSNYIYGGTYLSIVKDDLKGAEDIFEKGLFHYPNNYELNFNLGFLYAIEMQSYKLAYPLLKKIEDHPKAPRNIKSLAIKVRYMSEKNLEVAFALVSELYHKTKDSFMKEKLKSDLYSIKATLDLECLNKGNVGCSNKDYFGNPYIMNDKGKYRSVKDFKVFKLKKNN